MEIKVIASGSSGNCYHISDGKTSLLLDAGIPFKQIQIGCGFKTSEIKGCLVTHRHGDHAKAVPDLLKRGIRVLAPQDLKEKFPACIKVNPLEYGYLGSFEIMAFPVEHDAECYGYVLKSMETDEKLLYVTDTAYVKYTFQGLTHLMVEANYGQEIIMDNAREGKVPLFLAERVVKSHMSIETLLGLLRANDMSQVRQIYLLHLSDGNSNAEDFKRHVQEETGAEVYVF